VTPFLYVVEDDDDLRRLLVRSLAEEGFEAEGVASGSRALQRQSERSADAYVLDIGLPDADGRDARRSEPAACEHRFSSHGS
jgi:DNA-binding response OmpR family regulator